MRRTPSPTHEQTILRLAEKRGLLRPREVAKLGVPTLVLTRLVRSGKLERAGRGLYVLPGADVSANRSLAEVSLRVPRGVMCLLTALRVHEIGTQAPFQVWIALPHGMTAPRIKSPALRIVRMSAESLAEGVEHIAADGVKVPVFNPAKTVADCFKFRNKVGLDVALEALREAVRHRRATADAIWEAAKVCRVATVIRPYLESL